MHDIAASVAAISGHKRSPNFLKNQRWYPTIYDLRRGAQRRLAAFRLRIRRRRRGRRHRHQAQLVGARRHRDGAALWRDAGAAAGQGQAVRPRIHRAARRRADGQPDRGVARRRQAVRQGGAARRRALHARHAPAAPPSRRSRRSRPTCSGSSSIASPRTTTPSASSWCKRAEDAGVHVLMLTLDVPVRTIRAARGEGRRRRRRRVQGRLAHDARHGEMPRAGLLAMLQNGQPRFANIQPYAGPNASLNDTITLRAQGDGRRVLLGRGGALSRQVEEAAGRQGHPASGRRREGGVARRRRHPGVEPRRPPDRGAAGADRLRAGYREGGRRAGPRCCSTPACAAAPTSRARWRSAPRRRSPARPSCGASARSASEGPGHAIDLLIDELQSALGQVGARSPAEAQERHGPAPGRLRLRSKSSVICVAGSGERRSVPIERARLPGILSMSAIAEPPAALIDDRLAKRNALVLAVAQALAGGNNTVIVATAGIIGTGARAGQRPRHAADLGHGVRHVVRHAADGLAGAQLRPPLRAADRLRRRACWPG